MFDSADEFDLDIRFDETPIPTGGSGVRINAAVTGINCQVLDPTLVEATCENTCVECNIHVQPTLAFEKTCQDTCVGHQTCPVHTCGLDCETDTCPDATCGCNTTETCNQDICEGGGGGITAPPCDDPSGADDTCDACGHGGGGNPDDTDNCTGGAACTNQGCSP